MQVERGRDIHEDSWQRGEKGEGCDGFGIGGYRLRIRKRGKWAERIREVDETEDNKWRVVRVYGIGMILGLEGVEGRDERKKGGGTKGVGWGEEQKVNRLEISNEECKFRFIFSILFR